MTNKGKNIKLSLIFFAYFTIQNCFGQTQYPNIDTIYSRDQLEEMIQHYEEKKDTLGLAFAYWAYAKNEENANSLNDSPLTNLRKSMECFQAIKDSSNFYDVKGAIGSYFMDRNFIKKYAEEYIQSAVDYFEKKHKPASEIGHLINLTNIHIHENNFGPVEKLLQKAIKLNKEVKSEDFIGRIHSSYADYYVRLGKYKEAIENADLSEKIGKKLKIGWIEALSYYFKAKCYENLKQEDFRIKALNESLKIIDSNTNLYQLKKEVYYDIQDHYFKTKNYPKAYEYLLISHKHNEFIYNSKIESDLRSFSEYNLLEKQKMIVSKIELEKKLSDIEIEKLKIRQEMFIGILIFSMLIMILLTIAYINRKRINTLKVAEATKNNQIETLNALIKGQELERIRIAQELHDGLGTMLSRTKILMGKGTSLESSLKMIDEACSEVRNISSNLQPNTLTNFGLIKAIEDFVSKYNHQKPAIVFQYFGDIVLLNMNENLMIYRIVQELLTNSLKHAAANEILIQIMFTQESLNLTVEDDGVGFNENQTKSTSSGWHNIKSRVNYLQGTLNLHTIPSAGTSVTVSIPLK